MSASRRRLGRRISLILLAIVAIAQVVFLAYYASVTRDLPAIEDISRGLSIPSSYIYDRDGRLLYEIVHPEAGKHSPLPLSEIPLALRQAVVATEDATFYHNPGFSLRGILRSFWLNIRSGRVVAGGSTITQQLARNLIMDVGERYQQTFARKLREATLATRLTLHYGKDEILALYLNQTYFGHFAFGVEAAAQAYFGLHANELDLAQCALLAGLVQSPALYDPFQNAESAFARQRVVLGLMARQGYITPAEAELAAREPLQFATSPFPIEAPHFSIYVAGILERELGLERLRQGGLRVYTTLDLDMQQTAQALVRRHLAELNRRDRAGTQRRVDNAALVALDPHTGEILVLLGSPDYFDTRINGAVNAALALRQPGSSLKPFTYAAALESGLTPATLILDVPTSFLTKEGQTYSPRNYDLKFHGAVLLREALASSFNVPAVKVLDRVGVHRVAELVSALGVTTFEGADRYGLSLTLGGGEVRLLELTAAYAALAAGGRRVEPVVIRRVEDRDGRLLRTWVGGPSGQIISPQVAYLITDILADPQARVAGFGAGSVLELSRPAAVKTGTTTDWRDNWTIGYTPDLVVGVWVGNADNAPMVDVSGVSGAGPIWHDFMEIVLKGQPAKPFERPAGLIEMVICADSGELPNPDCPHTRRELFIVGTQPTEECTMHRRLIIDRRTGQLATADTPAEYRQEQVYTILPPEARQWGREQGLPEPPAEILVSAGPAIRSLVPLSLVSPDQGAVFWLSAAAPRETQRIEVAARPAETARFIQVELYVDDRLMARFATPPYATRWILDAGQHTFWARGQMTDGHWMQSEPVSITVKGP